MKNESIKTIKKNRERIENLSKEINRIAKLAKEDFKNVTPGKGSEENIFILGFIAGYKQKEKEL